MPSDANNDVGSSCLLLSHLRCVDDSVQLMLDYSTIVTPASDDCDDAVAPSNAATAVNIQLLKGHFLLFHGHSVVIACICNQLLSLFNIMRETCH